MKYNIVRLDYSIKNSEGNYHQTHKFSSHNKLEVAYKSLRKIEKQYNNVNIVDDNGHLVDFTAIEEHND